MGCGSEGDTHREMSSKKSKSCFLSIVYILFSVDLRVSHGDEFQEFLALTLPNMCPYSKFCTMGPLKEFNHRNNSPCCKPCSCDQDCRIIGNCCPDFALVRNSTTTKPSGISACLSPIHYGFDGFQTNPMHESRGLLFYYITTTCPIGYRKREVVNKCINPSRENLKDLVIVSDNQKRVFSNRYCAKCHGVKAFITWNLKLSCTRYPNKYTSVLTLAEMNENHCLILSEPPTMDIATEARCFPSDRRSCNPNEAVEPYMERACQSVNVPYVDVDFISATTYKNPYCYTCSMGGENENEIETLCPLDDPGVIRTGFTHYPFNAVLDMTITEKNKAKVTNTNANHCLPSEIFDHQFGKCRELNCPITMVSRDGKCAHFFKTTASLALDLEISISRMEVNEDTKQVFSNAIMNTDILIKLMEKIASDIFLDIGVHNFSCDQCVSPLYVIKSKTSYILQIGLQTNSKCQVADIINSLKEFRPTRKYSTLDKDMLQSTIPVQLYYDIQLVFGRLHHYPGELVGFMKMGATACLATIPLEPLFYCPYVDIQQNEYSQLSMSNNRGIDIAHFTAVVKRNRAGDYIGNFYRICVDNYLIIGNTGSITDVNPMLEYACMAMAVIVQL